MWTTPINVEFLDTEDPMTRRTESRKELRRLALARLAAPLSIKKLERWHIAHVKQGKKA
jgi:hypothetical protein